MKLSDIDKNFAVKTDFDREGLTFVDARELWLFGVFFDEGKYRRMPREAAESVSEGVGILHSNTAGGRVRFKTDSPYIAISVRSDLLSRMPHFSLTGTAGLDLYSEGRYLKTFIPPYEATDGFEGVYDTGSAELREYTLNMPLYSNVTELYVGIKEGSRIEPPDPYATELPVVFYGSSVTQGGCASRPGCSYESILCNRLCCDHINLGFSGSAHGEIQMAEYIAGLPMSAFVMDYDYNAPTALHLKKTHKPFFDIVRAKNPDLPIILMTRPLFYVSDADERRDIVLETYHTALGEGDKNVYFIDGRELIGEVAEYGLVDGCHPNDAGFLCMARAIEPTLRKALKLL